MVHILLNTIFEALTLRSIHSVMRRSIHFRPSFKELSHRFIFILARGTSPWFVWVMGGWLANDFGLGL
jgi:hypothetical protein